MRILVVVHGLPPTATGGAEIHAWDLSRELSSGGDEVLILAREADSSGAEHRARQETRDGVRIVWINHTFAALRAFSDSYDDDRITAVAEKAIDAFRPDVAHVHHLTCLSTGIVEVLRRRHIPIAMTLHDYWLVCHRGQLIDVSGTLCPGPGTSGCQHCLGPAGSMPAWAFTVRRRSSGLASALPRSMRRAISRVVSGIVPSDNPNAKPSGAHVDEAARRFRHMRALARSIDTFLAPSRFLLEQFVQAGFPRSQFVEAPYGIDLTRFALPPPGRPPDTGAPLRIGFLGSLMVSKAPHVLLEAVGRLPAGRVEVDLFGTPMAYHGDASYERQLAPLLAAPGVRRHDAIPHARVPSALASMDALVVPSVWPENSPLVIREAFVAGVPVVASDMGGIPETLAHGIGGLLFAPGDVEALSATLSRLIDEPDLLEQLRRSIPPVPSLADEAHALRSLLQSLVTAAAHVGHHSSSTAVAGSSHRSAAVPIAAVIVNYRAVDETRLAVHSVSSSDRPCARIVVVDNDTPGRARDALADFGSAVHAVSMPGNVGFPAGVNEGMRVAFEAGADRVLLLNSDAVLRPDAIGEMERVMDECQAGIVGPIVYSRANPDVLDTAGIAFDRTTGRMMHPGSGTPVEKLEVAAAFAVDAVSGCVMLIDRAVVDRVGWFDSEYFFGFEDIDFCLRSRAAGFPVVVASRAVAYHHGGQSLGEASADRFYYAARNHQRLARQTSPDAGAVTQGVRSGIIGLLNLAHAIRAGGGSPARRVSAVAQGTRDALSDRYGPRPR
jgi:GT2 family glycosyltransferase/glycosyltransferase involved in cell wall biosynthesis